MLRDITIGQYYPVESKIHRLDPRMKIIAVILYLISLFLFQNFAGYAVVTVFLGVVIVYSHVPLGYITKGLKPILFLLLRRQAMCCFSGNLYRSQAAALRGEHLWHSG